ncbi:MAG: DUF4041 domain-containing protein [Ignavibacteria bacterium]|nr:DUF4041 domain-containing protein [Ignavibacteria bacterium]MCU7503778.1 DUF4041 domain-containing protein [Ignavibacteria bacterium]MCU7517208.1 DUF4041 domain-containing protein [Ignavibacteria bacterium]
MIYLLILLLTLSVIAVIKLLLDIKTSKRNLSSAESNLQEANRHFEDESQKWKTQESLYQNEVSRLSKWTSVADADEKAAEILASAKSVFEQAQADVLKVITEAEKNKAELLHEAEEVLAKATAEASETKSLGEAEAKKIISEARQNANTLKSKAQAILNEATKQAEIIVETGNKRAEEIAGSAFEAMNNAALYEQTVKAMKNIIEGYGDQYIVPERSFLDDLSEEFGHTEAGVELKKARERSSLMVRNNTAAKCDYVEKYRHDTAVNFVIDAFNGRVDSILSRVKNDNAGTLEQEIRDSFTLVNYNGRAFRDAKITEEYLNARLEELKWAAVAQQLKMEEREEQRRIKEQIREEEKARREFERALKEAAKEEDMLQKAMEKAQLQMEKASAEQKAKYEQHLREIEQKLKEAEDRSKRALSMAQQTKSGHVYIISNIGSFGEEVYKIGLTRRLEPLDRIRELGDASVPFEFDVHAMIFSEDAPALERQLQNHFVLNRVNKINYRKEFFKVDLAHIRQEIEKLGIETHWTLTAQAREYRETLAIEQKIEKDPIMREAWINRQLKLEPETAESVLVGGEDE